MTISRCLLVVGLMLASLAAPSVPAQAGGEPSPAAGRPLPLPLHGVTSERTDHLDLLVRTLGRHRVTPTVRVVFQQGRSAASYDRAISRLRRVAYVMGQPFDSTATKSATVKEYADRVEAFARRFGDRVDIWEIGNELNGEWVGTPAEINAKVAAAFDVIEGDLAAEHLRSAITLNFWPSSDCYAQRWERTLPFARAMHRRVRRGVDFVFLSFYETACSPRARPSARRFAATLSELKDIFPKAQVGLGEVGAQGRADGLPTNPSLAEKQRVAERYYGMQAELRRALGRRYVGGYFWWYYFQDAVLPPSRRSLWDTLDDLLASY